MEQQAAPAVPLPGLLPDPEAESGGGMMRKLLLLIVILSGAGWAAWKIHANLTDAAPTAGAGSRQQAGGERAVPVTAASVQRKTMPIYLTALGTATAYYSVTIKSRVDGQLTAVDVREGQHVRRGQPVAQIDPAPYAAALAQAEGQLAKDQAAAVYANKEMDRYTALFNAGVVSQDSQQSLVANAGQIAGAIQADRAAIQAAKVNLDYTRITSPIDGVVGLRQVDPGNIVHAADTTGLLLITQLQPIAVVFTLPEDQLPQVQALLHKGATLAVEAYDRSQSTLLATGKLLTLDNQIDTTTGTDKVKAVFDNKDGALFPNQFVNMRLILQQRPDAIVIPSVAVQTGSQGNFVYVVKKGDPPKGGPSAKAGVSGGAAPEHKHAEKPADAPPAAAAASGDKAAAGATEKAKFYAELRPITIDVTEGTQVIVSDGLAAGEQVVVDGMEKLKNGSRVSPSKEAGKTGGRKSGAAGDSPSAASSAAATDEPTKKSHSGVAASGAAAAGGEAHEHHHHGQQP